MELPSSLSACLEAWTTDATVAFALLGSYARGDAGPFSDVDILRFVDDDKREAEPRSVLIGDAEDERGRDTTPRRWLVVRSTATPSQVESWFTEPEQAINVVAGLRAARPLWDPDGYFAAIRRRARQFRWTQAHQEKADRLAGQALVGWIEEVHKGLEGLRRNDAGRLLNARFGLSWGLVWVMRVQRGVLSASDNAIFDDVIGAVGVESRWVRLLCRVFGIDGGCYSLHEEALAGLLLYCETFELVKQAIARRDRALVAETARRIRAELEGVEDGGGPARWIAPASG